MAEEEKKELSEKQQRAVEAAQKRSKRFVLNLIIITGTFTVVAILLSSVGLFYVSFLLGVGLLPGIVAAITDGRPGRFASKTVMAFNISGLCPHLAAIATSGSPNQTSFAILQDPSAWLLVYGFAAFGWGMIFLIPHITYLYFDIKSSYVVKKLNFFQKALVEEWGEEIKQ